MVNDPNEPTRLNDLFSHEVLEHFPQSQAFELPRRAVLDWLACKGIGPQRVAESEKRVALCRRKYAREVAERKRRIRNVREIGGLYAQRFDTVPHDFEAALYVEVMNMLQNGRCALRCDRCKLPIADDGSPHSNRQRGRWKSGRAVYHPECAKEETLERKRKYFAKRSRDERFLEQHRKRSREYRRS
jgi:hypothetical protein